MSLRTYKFNKSLIGTLLTLTFVLLLAVSPTSAQEVDNYVIWWPSYTTNWLMKEETQIGGVRFLKYVREADYPRLKQQVDSMISTHKPDIVLIDFKWQDFQPLKTALERPEGWKLPVGNNTISDIVEPTLTLEYFDDLIALLQQNNIEVVLKVYVCGYCGQVEYPFSYYSRTGWFWKRPDWPHGLADPRTDAMRHPPSHLNGSDYNWHEHGTGYSKIRTDIQHRDRTSNGVELEGGFQLQVYEAPDMVFNGYDTTLHNNTYNVHSPIPSFSSQAYRDVVADITKQIGEHFRHRNILGYYLWTEQSYAHLRENQNLSSGWDGGTDAGPTEHFEVDYSQAELDRYNQWRASRGETTVPNIPFPINSNYDQFRKQNLADFMKIMRTNIQAVDPNAQIYLSMFGDNGLRGMAIDNPTQLRTLKPTIVGLEWPEFARQVFEDSNTLSGFTNTINNNTNAHTFISWYKELPMSKDTNYANHFATIGINRYVAPALTSIANQYSIWEGNTCSSCQFRYKNPATPNPNNIDYIDFDAITQFGAGLGNPEQVILERHDYDGDGSISILDYGILTTLYGQPMLSGLRASPPPATHSTLSAMTQSTPASSETGANKQTFVDPTGTDLLVRIHTGSDWGPITKYTISSTGTSAPPLARDFSQSLDVYQNSQGQRSQRPVQHFLSIDGQTLYYRFYEHGSWGGFVALPTSYFPGYPFAAYDQVDSSANPSGRLKQTFVDGDGRRLYFREQLDNYSWEEGPDAWTVIQVQAETGPALNVPGVAQIRDFDQALRPDGVTIKQTVLTIDGLQYWERDYDKVLKDYRSWQGPFSVADIEIPGDAGTLIPLPDNL